MPSSYNRSLESLIPAEALSLPVYDAGDVKGITYQTHEYLRRWGQAYQPLEFQQELIEGITRFANDGGKLGLLCLPTGSGKTLTASRIMLELLAELDTKSPLVVWLAPQKELLYQARDAFKSAWWSGVGPNSLDLIVVTKNQDIKIKTQPRCLFMTPIMAHKHLNKIIQHVDLVVFDEAHHAASDVFLKVWQSVVKDNETLKMGLGISATPTREDKSEVGVLRQAFENNLFVPRSLGDSPVSALIEGGVLSRPTFNKVSNVPKYAINKGPGDRRRMKYFISNLERWEAILSTLINDCQGQTVVYAFDRVHGKIITQNLRYLEEKAEYVDGETPFGDRISIFERFRNGITRVLVNVSLLIEGVDCPAAKNVLLTYPVNSQIRLQQMVGRVLRGPKVGGTEIGNIWALEGSQLWVERTVEGDNFYHAGWNVIQCEKSVAMRDDPITS